MYYIDLKLKTKTNLLYQNKPLGKPVLLSPRLSEQSLPILQISSLICILVHQKKTNISLNISRFVADLNVPKWALMLGNHFITIHFSKIKDMKDLSHLKSAIELDMNKITVKVGEIIKFFK